jgi:secreted PhoX family phosphatase
MGRFSHEAVGIDPRTSIAYLTEDDGARGSFLYRHVPRDRRGRPGAPGAGGTLDALALDEGPTRAVRWVRVRPDQANEDALARGAHRFGRLEGATFAGGAFWFDDTAGGPGGRGQVYRLVPGPDGDALERFLEADDSDLRSPDNVVVTPFGDLWFAEDGGGDDRVMGITPDGGVYAFARNRITDSEFAGPCFSPDGTTFFVNIQNPGLTLAIWGPFPAPSEARRRQMARAAPPAALCLPV